MRGCSGFGRNSSTTSQPQGFTSGVSQVAGEANSPYQAKPVLLTMRCRQDFVLHPSAECVWTELKARGRWSCTTATFLLHLF